MSLAVSRAAAQPRCWFRSPAVVGRGNGHDRAVGVDESQQVLAAVDALACYPGAAGHAADGDRGVVLTQLAQRLLNSGAHGVAALDTSRESSHTAGRGPVYERLRACCPRELAVAARSEESSGLSWDPGVVRSLEVWALTGRRRAGVAADGGRSVATGADGSASGREPRERSEARR